MVNWKAKVSMSGLCNADYDCPVKFAFINSQNQTIAEAVSTVREITQGKDRLELLPRGTLVFKNFKIKTEYQMIDYLRSGW